MTNIDFIAQIPFHAGKPPKRPERECLESYLEDVSFTRASRRSGLRADPDVISDDYRVSRGQAAEAA